MSLKPKLRIIILVFSVSVSGRMSSLNFWSHAYNAVFDTILFAVSTADLGATYTSIKINARLYENGAMYNCVGKHPALNRPLRTNIFLSVLFPPGAPKIEGYFEGDIVKEGDNLTLACTSRSGNPPARLIWLRNDVLVETPYSTARGETTNNHTFTVGPEDNNAVYKCEASSPLTEHPLSKSIRLNVM